MKSLVYLMRTTIKNRILELKKHPTKLILVLFLIVMFGFAVVTSLFAAPPEAKSYRPIAELYAIILGLYALIFGVGAFQGLSSGSSFFTVADVQLVFPSPISPRRVLLYGLIKQISVSLYVGFFILYQFSWVHNSYGISFLSLLMILFGYGICMFTSQLTAMTIYVFTSHNERSKNAVKIGFYAVLAFFLLYILSPVLTSTTDILGPVANSANSFLASLLPVAGWIKAAVVGCISGNFRMALAGFAATGLFIWVLLFAIMKAHSDFYEDVLQATEVSQSAITAKKEGNFEGISPQNVKTGRQGIGKGQGSSVFFYKHMLENRRSKLFLLDKSTLLFLIINVGFAYLTRENGLIPVLFFSTYLQLFSVAAGRWVHELKKPFVYLTPEPPFLKLVYLCLESICKAMLEAAVLYAAVGFVLHLSPLQITACIAMRIGFGLLLIAGNILIERILGTITSKAGLLILYLLIVLVLCAPGIVLGVILMSVIPSASLAFMLLTTFVWNTFASAMVLFFCRNILNYAELNDR